MSTRSYVGSKSTNEVHYVHFDGYPEARLPALAKMIDRDSPQYAVEIILSQGNKGGWSVLDADQDDSAPYLGDRAETVVGYGQAYRDGDYAPPTNISDGMSEDDRIWIEWVYLIDPETGNITYWNTEFSPTTAKTVSPSDILKELSDA